MKQTNNLKNYIMSHEEKVIQVLAKSHIRFQAALGQTVTLEEAIEVVKKEQAIDDELRKDEVWVDITTGKRIQGQY